MSELLKDDMLSAVGRAESLEHRALSSLFFVIASVVVACLIIYQPVFTHTFLMQWDDQWVVVNHYTSGGLNLINIKRILTEFYHGQYAPVNELYYLMVYSVFGYNAVAFHTGSLLIHIINSCLVYLLIRKILIASGNMNGMSLIRIPYMTAMIFAVHPFLVEGVAWLSASKNILYTTFYLVALISYIRYIVTRKYRYFLFSLLLYIISFGAKEQAVTLPICLLLFDYILNENLSKRSVWFDKMPFLLLSLFFGIVTMYSQAANGEGMLTSAKSYPFFQRIPMCAYTITEYITKCIFPIRLSYLYPFPILIGEHLQLRFWGYPAFLLFITAAFWKFWTQRWVLFGILFFIIHILLVANLFSLSRNAIVADRYVYLACIGIFFIISFLVDLALNKWACWYVPIMLGFTIYLIALGAYTYNRAKVWHSVDTLKYELRQLIMQRSDYLQYRGKYEN